MNLEDVLQQSKDYAQHYLTTLNSRGVAPTPEAVANLQAFRTPLPELSSDIATVLSLLHEVGTPATVASAGGRYFGFVTGSAHPAALAANWLAGAWDQNGALAIMSPVAATLEDVALQWILDLLHFPPTCGGGFVTGATMANFTALAAARHALLERAGWDIEAQGLFGAPPVTVVVGDEVHVSLLKALALLGFGRERVVRVPVDRQGRMRADALPKLTDMTLVCTQAGNVNTGAIDPIGTIAEAAQATQAWVHVDGAFGLWAAVSPQYAELTQGINQADSWATDAHKWLNVPYDSGIIICRQPETLRAAMGTSAAYLLTDGQREPSHYTPEMSRRPRGIDVWAVLRTLGRAGVVDLIDRTCAYARRFANGLEQAGYAILNDVVLNQVLVSFGNSATTQQIIAALQQNGECWCGGTVWQGQTAMRISVSSWATTEADIERSLAAMIDTANRLT